MDDWIDKIYQRWPEVAVLLAILFKSQLGALVPQVIKDYFTSRSELTKDKQEHSQSLEDERLKLDKLKTLQEFYVENVDKERVTLLLSEISVQNEAANDFIRQDVSDRLDIIIEQQRIIIERANDILRRMQQQDSWKSETQKFNMSDQKRE